MVSIVKKKNGKYTYYQIVKSVRINNKPTHKVLKHIGTAKKLWDMILGIEKGIVEKAIALDYGTVMSFYSLIDELELVKIINKYINKRNQGLNVGNYILIPTINACVDRCSKNHLIEWFDNTYLKIVTSIKPKTLSSDNIYNHMDYLTNKVIEGIEHDLTEILIKKFKIDTSSLIYDITSTYSFAKEHKKNKLLNKGYSRDHRPDLRQYNIALLITRKDAIPLMHDVFEGNTTDVTYFSKAIKKLKKRFRPFPDVIRDVTVIFDKGNNSEDNIKDFVKSLRSINFHFLGSLKPSDFKDMILGVKKFTQKYDSEDNEDETYFEPLGIRKIFGVDCKVVAMYNPDVKKFKARKFKSKLSSAIKEMETIKSKLNKPEWKDKRTVERRIDKMLIKYGKSNYINFKVSDRDNLILEYSVDDKKVKKYLNLCGKSLLFTDQLEWNNKDIVSAYKDKNRVEDRIKLLKKSIKIQPTRHWKDNRIRVHAGISIFALLLHSLLELKLKNNRIKMTSDRAIQKLNNIRYTSFKISSFDKTFTQLTTMTKQQKKMLKILNVKNLVNT